MQVVRSVEYDSGRVVVNGVAWWNDFDSAVRMSKRVNSWRAFTELLGCWIVGDTVMPWFVQDKVFMVSEFVLESTFQGRRHHAIDSTAFGFHVAVWRYRMQCDDVRTEVLISVSGGVCDCLWMFCSECCCFASKCLHQQQEWRTISFSLALRSGTPSQRAFRYFLLIPTWTVLAYGIVVSIIV